MIILTREAVAAVQSAMDRVGKQGSGLRIAAEDAGCSGRRYTMDFEREPKAEDSIVEIRDLRVFVDPASMALLAGTTIDYATTLEGTGFVFEGGGAEVAEHNCSCGKSCG